ncbi:MAG: hypothetical protein FJY17_05015, partial [Bacteroidetes bacterium]|nr:hypothetical protein [Bacteroidota bacterium]
IVNQSICAPNTYNFNGQTLTTTGTYTATLTNAAGCDSVITLNLTVNQPSSSSINHTICAPNTYSFNGQSYSTTGTYTATLTNAAGCDSVITLNLTVKQPSFSVLYRNICFGDTVEFNGLTLFESGIYLDTVINSVGCDSIIAFNLTVSTLVPDSLGVVRLGIVQGTPSTIVSVPVIASSLVDVSYFQLGVSFDSSILVYRAIRTGMPLLGQSLLTSSGSGRLNVAFIDQSNFGLSVCSDTIFWIDFEYSSQGGYSPLVWAYTLNQFGDSRGNLIGDIRYLNGMVYGSQVYTTVPLNNGDLETCEFTSAVFSVIGTGITDYQWKVSADGGRSFVQLTNGPGVIGAQSDSLILLDVNSGMNENVYICQVDGPGGVTASIAQRLEVIAATGLAMSISSDPTGRQCFGTSVTYRPVWSGSTIGVNYIWQVNGIFAGNDSILLRSDLSDEDLISLEIENSVCEFGSAQVLAQVESYPLYQMVVGGGGICSGQIGVPVGLSGSQTGIRYDLLINGTTTGITLMGTGGPLNFGFVNDTGRYSVRALTVLGCELMMLDTVGVFYYSHVAGTISMDDTISIGQSVQLFATGGSQYSWSPSLGLSNTSIPNPVAAPSQTTRYTVIISNVYGCADTLSVLITVIPPPSVFAGLDTAVCINSDTLHFSGYPGGGYWSGVGVVNGALGSFVPSVAGLGSHSLVYSFGNSGNYISDTVLITVLDVSIPTIINESICAPNAFSFGNQNIYNSGVYYDTLLNSVGCDSVLILNLTVNQPTMNILDRFICSGDSFHINGSAYYTTGIYTITINNLVGCDSIITLNLVVNPSQGDSVASLQLGVVQGTPGAIVSVPVLSISTSGVSSFQLGIYFDSLVLNYQNVRVGTVLQGHTIMASSTGNRVDFSFIDFSGMGFSSCGDTLFFIDFVLDSSGGFSPLVWDYGFTNLFDLNNNLIEDIRLRNGLVYSNLVSTPVPFNNGDQNVCEFDNATFTVYSVSGLNYQWMVSTDGGSSFVNLSDGAGVSGTQTDSLVLESVLVSMNGYIYQCLVQDNNGLTASIAQRLVVRAAVGMAATVTAHPSGVQCAGTRIEYRTSWMGPTTGLSYSWQINGQIVGSDSILVRSDLQNGDVVTVTISALNECIYGFGLDSAHVSNLPVEFIVLGGGDFCVGEPGRLIELSGSQSGVLYVLDINGASTTDTVVGTGVGLSFGFQVIPGQYSIRAFSTNGCSSLMTNVVYIDTFPSVNGTITQDTVIAFGNSVRLRATGGIAYEWSPSAGLSNSSIPNPIASPTVTTNYQVIITNLFGCTDTLFVLVTVLPSAIVSAGQDTAICINSGILQLSGIPAGGFWSGNGITNNAQGYFNPLTAGVGQHILVYSIVNLGVTQSDTIVITVKDISHPTQLNVSLCSPSGYMFNGQTLTTTGTYTATLQNAAGCDS